MIMLAPGTSFDNGCANADLLAHTTPMKIEGINLPGHFIARHGEVYFDPFHRGRILSRADVESILFRQGLELRDCHLQACPSRLILLRMLANLLHVYDVQGQCQKHKQVLGWMQALKCGLE
jgi:regulator of sirC expression with transglutaminase-like and TPR domain